MSVIHVAGSSIALDGRLIQRCAICGEKLIDFRDADLGQQSERGKMELAKIWVPGIFVEVGLDGRQVSYVCPPGESRPPTDLFCLSLVEY